LKIKVLRTKAILNPADMNNYRKLLAFLKDYRKLFAIAVAAMLFSSCFKMFELSMLVPLVDRIFNNREIIIPNNLPQFVVVIIDKLNSLEPSVILRFLPFVVLAGMVCKNALIYAYEFLMNDIAQRVMRDVRQKLYEKIQGLSLDYFSKRRTGELMARITNDVGVIESAVSYGVTDLFVQLFTIVGLLIMAFSIHFKAAVIIFCGFPLIIVPLAQLGRRLRKLSKSSQERMADINSLLLETISGIKVVKSFCTEDYETRRFYAKNHEFYKLRMKSTKRLLLQGPITEIFGVVCGIGIIFWLGQQVMNSHLSFGIFILFFASIMSIISPLKKLGNVNALTQQALSANERIHEVLETVATVHENHSASPLPVIKKFIQLEGVRFSYDQYSGEVLKGVDLTINAGELVAIVGPTGSGKTTLVNLIPRFYDPSAGKIIIDGIDLKTVSARSLRDQIGIVWQDPFLFNDTVRANIAYGIPNPSSVAVEEAARKAYAHMFVSAMPEKYDTIVGDRGFRLSGGEKQRLTIARAIFKNPPILILDEATSQLDSESEKFVQEALDKLMQGRTTIAIAHRLSTIKKADKIVVLEQGKIVGEGRHEQLLGTCPLYKRLYDTQFQM